MELTAVIEALASLKRALPGGALHRQRSTCERHHQWIHGWKQRGWTTADKKPVKNVELWQRLDALERRSTTCNGTGCAATPAIPATSAPTHWPTAAWTAFDDSVHPVARGRGLALTQEACARGMDYSWRCFVYLDS